MPAERLLSRRTVCDLIDVSDDTLRRMVDRGDFPPATHRLGQAERWRDDLVSAWLIVQSVEFSGFFEELVKRKAPPATGRKGAQGTANSDPDPAD